MLLVAFELCMDNEKNHISTFTTIKVNFYIWITQTQPNYKAEIFHVSNP